LVFPPLAKSDMSRLAPKSAINNVSLVADATVAAMDAMANSACDTSNAGVRLAVVPEIAGDAPNR